MRRARSSLLLTLALVVSACGAVRDRSAETADILLYDGTGASPGGVRAVEAILANNHLSYARVDAAELEALSPPALRRHALIIIPGGDFIAMNDALSPRAVANIRRAVGAGVGYLGICGGGFLAGRVYDKGLDLASGAKFGFYSAESHGVHKAAVPITAAGGPTLEQYWEDGPEFTGWGSVIGRYPDGTPAVVEGRYGKGRVILTGIHAEAPEGWRRGMRFATPVKADNDYAAGLIRAALNGQRIAHY